MQQQQDYQRETSDTDEGGIEHSSWSDTFAPKPVTLGATSIDRSPAISETSSQRYESAHSVTNNGTSSTGSPERAPLPSPHPTAGIGDLTAADLYVFLEFHSHVVADCISDELYFDRIHMFAPFLNRRRYFICSRQGPLQTEERTCLRHAMWTLAASMSTQFHHVRDSLYSLTRQKLEEFEVRDTQGRDCGLVEQTQSWILLALYDFTRTQHRRAWLSAGRAIRLAQLLKLYALDDPSSDAYSMCSTQADWVELEERRRTFWMVFCLDRLASVREMWPLTLIEHEVSRPTT